LNRWEERWADMRIHGTTKCLVAVFAEERSSLLPLPLEQFRFHQFGEYLPLTTIIKEKLW
jgi:hypothetical protein